MGICNKISCPFCGNDDLEHTGSEFVDDCISAMFITQDYTCHLCKDEFQISVTYGMPQDITY